MRRAELGSSLYDARCSETSGARPLRVVRGAFGQRIWFSIHPVPHLPSEREAAPCASPAAANQILGGLWERPRLVGADCL